MAPCKGPHLAIEAARRAGVRLKLAAKCSRFFATTGKGRSSRSVRLDLLVTEGLHQHGRDDQTRQGVIDADDFFQRRCDIVADAYGTQFRALPVGIPIDERADDPPERVAAQSMAQTFAGGKTADGENENRGDH
jgi:hypothetical protein